MYTQQLSSSYEVSGELFEKMKKVTEKIGQDSKRSICNRKVLFPAT